MRRSLILIGAAMLLAANLVPAMAGRAGAAVPSNCTGEAPPFPADAISYLRSYRAPFAALARLAIDSADNLYVTDPRTSSLVVRAPDGRVTARLEGLGHALSVAVDDWPGRPFRIYLGDGSSGRVSAYSDDWQWLFALGQGDGEFLSPTDIAIDPVTGRVYVADNLAHEIKVYASDGSFFTSFGGFGAAPGLFNSPAGVFIAGGEMLVSDQLNYRIQLFTLAGGFVCSIGGDLGNDFVGRSFIMPQGVWVDGVGRIYVADAGEGRIRVVDRLGNLLADIGDFGRTPGALRVPLDLVMDGNNRLFVAAANNARLEVYGVDLLHDPELYAPAVVEIEPDPFDHRSAVERFVARIEVPGYRLGDIDLDSIRANGVPPEPGSASIGDREGDGETELSVSFDRHALAATLPVDGPAEILIQGRMAILDFDGRDMIAVTGGVIDGDGDGVRDDADACLDTAPGAAVDVEGCSIAQLCPCNGPDAEPIWRRHGDYVACISGAARSFARAGRIGKTEIGGFVREAAVSACGR